MTPDDYLRVLRSDGAALAVAARTDLEAPISGCPGWTMTRLLTHMGQVHQWADAIVGGQSLEPVDRKTLPPAPEGPEVVDWYAEGVETLAATLADRGPESPAWNWMAAPQTADFWFRRQPVETAIHRWDAEDAVGNADPIDTELAIDGIDETLDLWVPSARKSGPFSRPGSTAHLHATDAEGEWLLTFGADSIEVGRGHAKGDAALRGPASSLLLFLWKRISVDSVSLEVFGEGSVLDQWTEELQL